MSALPDNTEPDRRRRSTDRRIKASRLFRGAKTREEVRAAFVDADAQVAPFADEIAVLRAKITELPPAADA